MLFSLYVVLDISRTLEVNYFCLDVLSAAARAFASIDAANAEKETVVATNTAKAVAIRFVFIIKTPNLTFLQITLHLGFIIHNECQYINKI